MEILYVICVLLCLSGISGIPIDMGSSNPKPNEEMFPFLTGLSQENKDEFLNIIFSKNLSFSQKLSQCDLWAEKQEELVEVRILIRIDLVLMKYLRFCVFNSQFQEAYFTWINETKTFFNLIIEEHQRKTASLSSEAKAADEALLVSIHFE